MRKWSIAVVALALFAVAAAPALAGNGAPSGSHYSLNIIGVENPKTADMTSSNRHTIFVALGKGGTSTSYIYLRQGPYKVCDGNAFDPAWSCQGTRVGTRNGAVFQLPSNYSGCDVNNPDDPCWDSPTTYEIWLRGLGSPSGSAEMTTCREAKSDGTLECSTETVDIYKDTKFRNETKKLTTVCLSTDADPACEVRQGIFYDPLYEYLWEYANSGLRLAQLRIYPAI
jgi:hypothetical protein